MPNPIANLISLGVVSCGVFFAMVGTVAFIDNIYLKYRYSRCQRRKTKLMAYSEKQKFDTLEDLLYNHQNGKRVDYPVILTNPSHNMYQSIFKMREEIKSLKDERDALLLFNTSPLTASRDVPITHVASSINQVYPGASALDSTVSQSLESSPVDAEHAEFLEQMQTSANHAVPCDTNQELSQLSNPLKTENDIAVLLAKLKCINNNK